MNDLRGAKILLFYPYGATKHYGESIKNELKRRGAIVIGYDERPSQNPIIKIIIRLFKKRVPYIFSTYLKKIIKINCNIEFDYVLVLRGEAFTEQSVSLLKNHFKKAIFILYLWDILKSTNLQDVIPFFDRVLSFDPDDVMNNKGLIFRPTFFIPEYCNLAKDNNCKFDIIFIGTLHSNRYQLLNLLKEYLKRNIIKYYFYLYVPGRIVLLKNKFIDKIPVDTKDIYIKPLTLKDTLHFVSSTKCILDLNFTGQKSLSMRAFEAMASKTKYITTNQEIMNYDFYDENNILVIDTSNINIPRNFIDSPFNEIPTYILNKYSVESLVNDLFQISILKHKPAYFNKKNS